MGRDEARLLGHKEDHDPGGRLGKPAPQPFNGNNGFGQIVNDVRKMHGSSEFGWATIIDVKQRPTRYKQS
jgi:hypothetical protein